MKTLLLALLTIPALAYADLPSVDVSDSAALNGVSSSLTLYVYPPRNSIDWSSPKNALRSIGGNFLEIELGMNRLVPFLNGFGEESAISSNYKSSMGHTIAHIRCSLRDGELVDRWVSFSGEDYVEADKQLLVKEKAGLGVLFNNYIDGHIIYGAENIKRIAFYKGDREHGSRKRPRYLQFEVDESHCLALKRMTEFFLSFHFAPGTPYATLQQRAPEDTLYFTNMIDPYESYMQRLRTGHGLVGGGCAPFGAALLKMAGRFRSEFDSSWRTPVTISEKLIGNQYDPHIQKVRRVSVHELLFSSLGDRWTYEDEGYANRSLNMYDPLKIWDFAGRMINCVNSRACAELEGNFLGNEYGRIRAGVTQLFRDTVARAESSNGESSGQPTVSESVEQPVEGFVWRIR